MNITHLDFYKGIMPFAIFFSKNMVPMIEKNYSKIDKFFSDINKKTNLNYIFKKLIMINFKKL